MRLLQIVPSAPPALSGVSDYALVLARGFRLIGVSTTFAAAHQEANVNSQFEGFPIIYLDRTPASSAQLLSSFDHILLHYVGYGYEKRGCPFWLEDCLRLWSKDHPKRKLVTMFHELYAFGKPWQSSFWTHPLQKRICRDIARFSDGVVTNRLASAEVLQQMRNRQDVLPMAVFSTVGEPENLPLFESRERRLVIFGSEKWRRAAIIKDLAAIKITCKRWGISEVVEIGSGSTVAPDIGLSWKQLGALSAREVSLWLSKSLLGFISYLSSYLEKSTIFSAYAAHGLTPILPDGCIIPRALGVTSGFHFLGVSDGITTSQALKAIGLNVFQWYQTHTAAKQVDVFSGLFSSKEQR